MAQPQADQGSSGQQQAMVEPVALPNTPTNGGPIREHSVVCSCTTGTPYRLGKAREGRKIYFIYYISSTNKNRKQYKVTYSDGA